MVDKILLRDAIRESGKTLNHLAEKCGLTRQGFYLKLYKCNDFTSKEIGILCKELCIDSLEEKERIFFGSDVSENVNT